MLLLALVVLIFGFFANVLLLLVGFHRNLLLLLFPFLSFLSLKLIRTVYAVLHDGCISLFLLINLLFNDLFDYLNGSPQVDFLDLAVLVVTVIVWVLPSLQSGIVPVVNGGRQERGNVKGVLVVAFKVHICWQGVLGNDPRPLLPVAILDMACLLVPVA